MNIELEKLRFRKMFTRNLIRWLRFMKADTDLSVLKVLQACFRLKIAGNKDGTPPCRNSFYCSSTSRLLLYPLLEQKHLNL